MTSPIPGSKGRPARPYYMDTVLVDDFFVFFSSPTAQVGARTHSLALPVGSLRAFTRSG